MECSLTREQQKTLVDALTEGGYPSTEATSKMTNILLLLGIPTELLYSDLPGKHDVATSFRLADLVPVTN